MNRVFKVRALLGLAHIAACATLLWFFYPSAPQDLKTVEGVPVIYKGGGRISSTTFQVGDVVMSCSSDPLGPRNSCPTQFLRDISAKATYFYMRTLMSVFSNSPGAAILIKLEQEGKVIMLYTSDDFFEKYAWNSLLPILFFGLSYVSFLKLNFFKKVN